MRTDLVVYTAENCLIKEFARSLKAKVLVERKRVKAWVDDVNTTFTFMCDAYPELLEQISAQRALIRLRTKGTPATEDLPSVNSVNSQSALEAANFFLLKKAYRQAANLSHPDKGGSDEDFQNVKAAYKAGDLGSLNEYVIARNHNLIAQTKHWQIELEKPNAQWQKIVSEEPYRAVALFKAGNKKAAMVLTKKILELTLVSLIKENSAL